MYVCMYVSRRYELGFCQNNVTVDNKYIGVLRMYVCMYVTLWMSDRICCGMGRGDHNLFFRTPIVTDGLRDVSLEMDDGSIIATVFVVVPGRSARRGHTVLCLQISQERRRRSKHLWEKKVGGHIGTGHRTLHGRPHRGMYGRADHDCGGGCNVRVRGEQHEVALRKFQHLRPGQSKRQQPRWLRR